MMADYQNNLIESINSLIQVRHKLFGEALNLAMSGVMSEINDAFELGDTYKFELSHLKGTSDINVTHLVSLIEKIETTIDRLIVENEIKEDEIKWDEDQPEADENPFEMDAENDDGEGFDWLITYEDGKQESFHGFAGEAFKYALTKNSVFSVEKIE